MCLSRACPTVTEPFLINRPARLVLAALTDIWSYSFPLVPELVFLLRHFFFNLRDSSAGKCVMMSLLVLSSDLWFNWLLPPFFHDNPLIVTRRRCWGHACHVNKDVKPHVSLHHGAKSGPVREYRSLIAFAWWCSTIVPPRCHLCQTRVHVIVNRPEKSP